jgi:hypothetical protein
MKSFASSSILKLYFSKIGSRLLRLAMSSLVPIRSLYPVERLFWVPELGGIKETEFTVIDAAQTLRISRNNRTASCLSKSSRPTPIETES